MGGVLFSRSKIALAMSNGSSALLVSCSYASWGEPRALACNRQIILVWYLVDLSSGESPNQGVCGERGRDLRRPDAMETSWRIAAVVVAGCPGAAGKRDLLLRGGLVVVGVPRQSGLVLHAQDDQGVPFLLRECCDSEAQPVALRILHGGGDFEEEVVLWRCARFLHDDAGHDNAPQR